MSTEEETAEKVEEVLKPGKFSIVDAIQGQAMPEQGVRVYTDLKAAMAVNDATQDITVADLHRVDGEDVAESELETLEATLKEAQDELLKTSYVFHLRGLSRDEWEDIRAEYAKNAEDDDEAAVSRKSKDFECELFAKSLQSVEDNDGSVDDSGMNVESTKALRNKLPVGEWQRLTEVVNNLTFANTYIDQAVNSSFLPRR